MAKLILNPQEVECLEVVIGDKTYNIPLGSSLSTKELAKMDDKATRAMIESYLWPDALEELPIGMAKKLIDAWSEETAKACGVSLGKLQASRYLRKSTARH